VLTWGYRKDFILSGDLDRLFILHVGPIHKDVPFLPNMITEITLGDQSSYSTGVILGSCFLMAYWKANSNRGT
jgi:hypothetical protein